jgi:hypothetical protein
MIQTIEVVIDEQGKVQLLQNVTAASSACLGNNS